MNKRMREIMAAIQEKTLEAKKYMTGEGVEKDVTKAGEIMDAVDALRTEYETEKRIFEASKEEGGAQTEPHGVEEPKTFTAEEIVAKEVRAIMAPATYAADKSLVESVDASGGYTVPEDIQTKINQWPDVQYSFLDDISVESVSTNKGARTYQTKKKTDAFIDMDENGALTTELTAPTFERVSYNIQDRAGFMPVSNDLIEDSDANINAVVTDWLSKANVATANKKILEIIQKKEQIELDGIEGIKKTVNVTLGQAYKAGTKIITNDDGLNYLDTLTDTNGRPLLNPDPTDSARMALRCGTVVVPIKVVPNDAFPTAENKIPVIVGDLKAGIRKYDRKSMSLKASDVATIGTFNAFAQNMTLIRAILRDDYKELDGDAYVYGYITAGE